MLQALRRRGRRALKTRRLIAAAMGGVALSLVGLHELAVLLGIGLVFTLFGKARNRPEQSAALRAPMRESSRWNTSSSPPSALRGPVFS